MRRYLIGAARGASLATLVPALKSDAGIRIVRDDDPKLLVVEMSDEHAKELRRRFAGRLVIERDALIHPFDP